MSFLSPRSMNDDMTTRVGDPLNIRLSKICFVQELIYNFKTN